ncbi:MAG: tape measure protein [Clostridia bacterium]|nr:tape measure protein [Clostridia bacterium]
MKVGELFAQLRLSDKDFYRGLKGANKGFSSFVDSITSNAVTIGTVIGGIATGALTQLGIGFNASMEQAQMGFTTMLGSAEKADAFLKELADFAKNTPFDFPGLRDAAKKMIAFGFESKQVIPTLTAVGDAVAAVGGGQEVIDRVLLSMGQIKATGRATWQEIKQMGENGIPALSMLAEAFNTTEKNVMDMLSKGVIPADKAIQILTEGMNKRYGGMMKNMENTWNGMVSNIKDGATFLVGSAFAPIFNILKGKVLPVVKDTVAELQQNFDSGGGLAGALKILVPPGLSDNLKDVSDFIAELKTKIQSQDWESVGKAIGEALKKMVQSMTGFGKSLIDKLGQEMEQIDWAAVGRNSVKVAAGFALGFAAGLLDPAVWWQILKEHWDVILEVILGIVLLPEGIVAKIAAGLAKIPLAGKFLSWMVTQVSKFGKEALAPVGQLLKDFAGAMMDGFTKSIGLSGGKLLPKLLEVITGAVNGIKDFGETLYLKGMYFMERLGAGLANAGPKQVVQKVRDIIANVDSFLSGTISKFIDKGRNIVEGLWQGISEKGGWLVGKIKTFVSENIVQPVKNLLGIQSPSKVMAEFGKYVAEGLAQGIEENKGKVADKSKLLAEAIAGALDTIQSKLNLTGDIAKAKFDLFMAKMGETATESEKYKTKLDMLNTQLAAQNDTVTLVQRAYDKMVKVKGQAASESQKLYLQLLQEQKAQSDLRAEIAATNKTQAEKRTSWTAADYLFDAAQKAWDSGNTRLASDYMNTAINGGGPAIGSDEYRAANPDMPDWLGGGKVTALASGGIVTRPTLAMVGEGGESEAVLPLSRLGDMGGGEQTIIIQLDGRIIAKQTVQHMPGILRLSGVKI